MSFYVLIVEHANLLGAAARGAFIVINDINIKKREKDLSLSEQPDTHFTRTFDGEEQVGERLHQQQCHDG